MPTDWPRATELRVRPTRNVGEPETLCSTILYGEVLCPDDMIQNRGVRSARMKLATFTEGARTRIGVVEGDDIVDLSTEPALPTDMIGLIGGGTAGLEAARAAAQKSKKRF